MNLKSELQIVHAVPEDAEEVAQINVDGWLTAYQSIVPADYLASLKAENRVPGWRGLIESETTKLIVARRNGVMLGWVNFSKSRDKDPHASDGEVWAIYVKPDTWSQGVGKTLWSAAHACMLEMGFRNCSLWVFPQNSRAIRFYETIGFACDPCSEKSFQLSGISLKEIRYSRIL